jgi:hemerythrin-like metal-binding protein
MSKIVWEARFSVGVERLDEQHKGLIRIINQLEAAQQEGGMMARVISDLRAYVNSHFREEEAMLQAAGYADFESHRKQHKAFEEWLKSVETAYNSGYSEALDMAESISAYLHDWLINHILTSDMAYKPLLSGRQPPQRQ